LLLLLGDRLAGFCDVCLRVCDLSFQSECGALQLQDTRASSEPPLNQRRGVLGFRTPGWRLGCDRLHLRLGADDLRAQLIDFFPDDSALPFERCATTLELADLTIPNAFDVGVFRACP